MRWRRSFTICTLALGLSCGEGFTNIGGLPQDGSAGDYQLGDSWFGDRGAADAQPGAIELVSGSISSLGGISATETKLEVKPDFEVTDDGLEYSGIHGVQCTADKVLCITEGGFAP